MPSKAATSVVRAPSPARLSGLDPFLARARLLDRLPDQNGHVVWLRAPYGYGKSVLIAQWVTGLERAGRRVLWVGAEREEPRAGLAAQLGLPSSAPWPVVLDELDAVDSVVVLEEAEAAGEALDRLLTGNRTLLAIASRGPLPSLELPRVQTRGKLLRLEEADLAFTREEAVALARSVSGPGDAVTNIEQIWNQTAGWPLPLHFALLGGGTSPLKELSTGLIEALPEGLRAELFLLAAVAELPKELAGSGSGDLVARGLAQERGGSYLLHPLLGEQIVTGHADEATEQLARAADRLPWPLRAAALARLGLNAELGEALEDDAALRHAGADPAAWLSWHAVAPGADRPMRRLGVAIARSARTEFGPAVDELLALLPDDQLPASARTVAAARVVTALAGARRLEEAERIIAAAQVAVSDAPAAAAWALGHALALFEHQSGRLEAAVSRLTNLVSGAGAAGADPAASLSAELLMHLASFEITGDHLAYIAALEQVLRDRPGLGRAALTTIRHNLGIHLLAVGERERAGEHLRAVAADADRHARTVVGMALAYLDGDVGRFPHLLAESRLWEYDMLSERVAALWMRTLRAKGDAEAASEVAKGVAEGPFVLLETAWQAAQLGDPELANERLTRAEAMWERQGSVINRDFRQHHAAVDFVVNGGTERLERLLALSPHRERVLPSLLVPLDKLPRDRPELSVHFPLAAVLSSGWAEAISLRVTEVPPLEVKLLGNVSVSLMGEQVRLSRRHRELLTLIAMAVPRSRWGEELWPESDAGRSENNLRVQLHLLRRALAPWDEQRHLRGESLENATTDLVALRVAISAGDAELVADLYTGDLASDVDLAFVEVERAELRRRVVDVLSRAAGVTPRDTDPLRVARLLERALEIEPLDEELLRKLVALHLQAGRRAAAERHARAFEERLIAETGYSLAESTRQLLGPGWV